MRTGRGSSGVFGTYPLVAIIGTTYYVSSTGSNSNDGRSPATAWQTIAKVNATTFNPGDHVLFRGGQSFSGNLVPTAPNVLSTSQAKVTYGSYGTGNATIFAATGHGVEIVNKSRIAITFLTVDGTDQAGAFGVFVHTTTAATQSDIDATFLTITDFELGIYAEVLGANGSITRFAVANCSVSSCTGDGIASYCDTAGKLILMSVTRSVAFSNGASGIVLGGVAGALIEYCEAYANGAASTAGPVGIWYYQTSNGVVRYCYSHDNVSGNSSDGGGFDIDGDCANCVIEYCYSKGNQGAGFMIYAYDSGVITNCIVRFCISVNDGSDGANFYGGLLAGGGSSVNVNGAYFYNNVVYQSRANKCCVTTGTTSGTFTNVRFLNNVIYGSSRYMRVSGNPAGLLFQGNSYFGGGDINWNSVTYATVALWQAALTSQEKVSGVNVAITANPLLVNPGSAPSMNPAVYWDPSVLSGYKPLSGSPVLGAGVNLNALYGLTKPLVDFYGASANAGYDVGASFTAGS